MKKNTKNRFFLTLFSSLMIFTACQKKEDNTPPPPPTVPTDISQVQATGEILPKDGISNIASEVGGIVQELRVAEGDQVEKGQIIAVLSTQNAQLNEQEIKTKIATQEAQIQANINNNQQYLINIKDQEQNLATSQKLLAEGAETQQNVTNQANQLALQKAALAQNKKNIAVSQKQLAELKVQLQQSQNSINTLYLKAPESGTLKSLNIQVGDAVTPNGQYAELIPNGDLIAQAEVDELFANRVKIGQPVSIERIGYPEVLATGKVIQADNFLGEKTLFTNQQNDRTDTRVRKVKILIENNAKGVLIGSEVNCLIKIKN